MGSCLRYFLKFIAAGIILLLICVAISIAAILIQRSSAEEKVNEQLGSLDPQFDVPGIIIPPSVKDEMIMPSQVGNFKRVELGRSTNGNCAWNSGKTDVCLFAAYTLNTDYHRIWLKAGVNAQVGSIKDRVGSMLCSSTLGGELHLRTKSQHPYLYLVCSPQFQTGSSVYGVSWQNGTWFIGLMGEYDLISQFIAAYPY